MDTTYVWQRDGVDVRACTDCDFEEQANFTDQQQKELPTRVNQTVDKTVIEIQTIKIIDKD